MIIDTIFEDCKVTDVKTVAEFLDKYCRKDRYTDIGRRYAETVLKSHERNFEKFGYDWLSRHESVTNEVVSFYGCETE